MTNYLIVTNLNVISHQGFSMLQTTCTASDKTHKPLAVRVERILIRLDFHLVLRISHILY